MPRCNTSYFGQQKYSDALSTHRTYRQSHFFGRFFMHDLKIRIKFLIITVPSSITKQCAVCTQTITTVQASL